MPTRLTTLTSAQWQALVHHREAWYAIGAACGPTDRAVVQDVIGDFYQRVGYASPEFWFVQSPAATVPLIGPDILCYEDYIYEINSRLRNDLFSRLWEHLAENTSKKMRIIRTDHLWLWVSRHLGSLLRDGLIEELALPRTLYIPHRSDLAQVSGYLYMQRLGVSYDPADLALLHQWARLCQSCGGLWPHKQICIVVDRPIAQHVDGQRRLHCTTGPAMRFADGASLYAVHGVRVHPHIIEHPEDITLEQIQRERNHEMHRILIEQYGWDRYLTEAQAVLVDGDVDTTGSGTLRALYRTEQATVLVCTCDSTGDTHYLPVLPSVMTCHEAAAWLAGHAPGDFHLLVES